ncbi:MAG: aminotransferase class I/II-fold pyridoxal phosphate-dependent enzyme, partial [Anaerolineales bacterium]
MQHGAVRALTLADDYYRDLAADYQHKRDYLAAGLREAGLEVDIPAGCYFLMAGIRPLGFDDDFAFCKHLAANVGVAAIPPSAFFSAEHKALGKFYARFAFCKTMGLLEQARERLLKLRRR